MTGNALLETMSDQVAAQCEHNLAEARAEAEAILKEAKAQSTALRDEALKATASEMALLKTRWELKAEAEAAKAELTLKKIAVEGVLATVAEHLQEVVNGAGFPSVLDALMAELMEVAEGEVVAIVPEAHLAHVTKWLSKNGHDAIGAEGSATLRDGVALQDPARTFRISNTLSTRFGLVDQAARKVSMTSLFGSENAVS